MRFLYEKLTPLREKKGLNQTQLAAAVGVTAVAVDSWERGKYAPSGKYIGALATALGVTPNFFYPSARPGRSHRAKRNAS